MQLILVTRRVPAPWFMACALLPPCSSFWLFLLWLALLPQHPPDNVRSDMLFQKSSCSVDSMEMSVGVLSGHVLQYSEFPPTLISLCRFYHFLSHRSSFMAPLSIVCGGPVKARWWWLNSMDWIKRKHEASSHSAYLVCYFRAVCVSVG